MTEVAEQPDTALIDESSEERNIPRTPLFDRDAWRFVVPLAILTLLLLVLSHLLSSVWLLVAGCILLLASVGIALFFRDPERELPCATDVIVSPADGRIVSVCKSDNGRHRVDIFLSVFDVHINRIPFAGHVTSIERRKGGFAAAYTDEASQRNECVTIKIDSTIGTIEVRQIAGVLARRIVCRLAPGTDVLRGQRLGLIRFGSRTEIEWSQESGYVPTVQVGERVMGARTIIGTPRNE